MPTAEQSWLRNHLQHATAVLDTVDAQFEALRAELYAAQKQLRDTEQSRDLIRSHAQASLEKYRAQDKEVQTLRALLQDAIDAWDSDDDITKVLERGRAFLNQGRCGREAANQFYRPCTRAPGHDGPCAHPHA